SQLVGESVFRNSEEPGAARAKQALSTQEVLQLRVGMLKLEQHLFRARPACERDPLNTMKASSSRKRLTRSASDDAPATCEDVARWGKPEKQVGQVGYLEGHFP